MKNCFHAVFYGPFPVKIDNFRSQGVTSGICQCHLRLRSEQAVYAHTGSIDSPDLYVDQTLVKLIKNRPIGGFWPHFHSRRYPWLVNTW